MKIPVQSKIAELESRIRRLEQAVFQRSQQRVVAVTESRWSFGYHWREMWHHFHAVMARVFKF